MEPSDDAMVLRHEAEAGDLEAQLHYGIRCEQGYGVEQDYSEAVAWYRRGAEAGYAAAAFALARMYLRGLGVTRDADQCGRWLASAASQGHITAIFTMGLVAEWGLCGRPDPVSAAVCYHRGATLQHGPSIYRYAHCLRRGFGIAKNETSALESYARAAGREYPYRSRGVIFPDQHQTPLENADLHAWFSAAAALGIPVAQWWQAHHLQHGHDCRQDRRAAAQLYLRAAEAGFPPAQFRFALMLESHEGVDHDLSAAIRWLSRAAVGGHAPAQLYLSDCFRDGKGMPPDAGRAREWQCRAAEQGWGNFP